MAEGVTLFVIPFFPIMRKVTDTCHHIFYIMILFWVYVHQYWNFFNSYYWTLEFLWKYRNEIVVRRELCSVNEHFIYCGLSALDFLHKPIAVLCPWHPKRCAIKNQSSDVCVTQWDQVTVQMGHFWGVSISAQSKLNKQLIKLPSHYGANCSSLNHSCSWLPVQTFFHESPWH